MRGRLGEEDEDEEKGRASRKQKQRGRDNKYQKQLHAEDEMINSDPERTDRLDQIEEDERLVES